MSGEALSSPLVLSRDECIWHGRRLCFYKRAQIFVADIWGLFSGQGLGALDVSAALGTGTVAAALPRPQGRSRLSAGLPRLPCRLSW